GEGRKAGEKGRGEEGRCQADIGVDQQGTRPGRLRRENLGGKAGHQGASQEERWQGTRMKSRDSVFPSTDAIVAYIRAHPGEVGTKEIAREFGLKNADRAELKRILRELADRGT